MRPSNILHDMKNKGQTRLCRRATCRTLALPAAELGGAVLSAPHSAGCLSSPALTLSAPLLSYYRCARGSLVCMCVQRVLCSRRVGRRFRFSSDPKKKPRCSRSLVLAAQLSLHRRVSAATCCSKLYLEALRYDVREAALNTNMCPVRNSLRTCRPLEIKLFSDSSGFCYAALMIALKPRGACNH